MVTILIAVALILVGAWIGAALDRGTGSHPGHASRP